MDEKRRFVRFRAPFCISFSAKDSSRELPGVIRDISMGGVRVLLDTPLDILPDILISLYILLPRNTLRLLGRVVWTKAHDGRKEIGVCFVPTKKIFIITSLNTTGMRLPADGGSYNPLAKFNTRLYAYLHNFEIIYTSLKSYLACQRETNNLAFPA